MFCLNQKQGGKSCANARIAFRKVGTQTKILSFYWALNARQVDNVFCRELANNWKAFFALAESLPTSAALIKREIKNAAKVYYL